MKARLPFSDLARSWGNDRYFGPAFFFFEDYFRFVPTAYQVSR
jgi:hypothetical protein